MRTKWIFEFSVLVTAGLLAAMPAVAAAPSPLNFSAPVVLSATEAAGVWYPDRYPPCVFTSPATAPDGSGNALRESICASAFQTPVSTQSFYNTQGRKFDLPSGTTSLSIDLYIPAGWRTRPTRDAGFWGTALSSTSALGNDYPIIEFQGPITTQVPGPSYFPNGGTAGFYGWNNVTSTFDFIGLPAGFTYDSWVQLTYTLVPGTGFVYTVSNLSGSGAVSLPSPFFDPTETSIANVILEGYNYDADYNIFWSEGPALTTLDTAFQVSYAANPSAGESYINLINTGANGNALLGPGYGTQYGNICVNVYAFAPDEQEISCCSCLITPNSVVNLGVNRDLTSMTLTGVVPSSVVIKVLSTLAGTDGTGTSCSQSAASGGTLAAGLVASGTTPQPVGGTYSAVEHPFVPATLSAGEYASITGRCASILGNGSSFGVCNSCQAGALGASKK